MLTLLAGCREYTLTITPSQMRENGEYLPLSEIRQHRVEFGAYYPGEPWNPITLYTQENEITIWQVGDGLNRVHAQSQEDTDKSWGKYSEYIYYGVEE